MDERVTKKKITRRYKKSSPRKKSVTKRSSDSFSIMKIEDIFKLITEYTYDWELLLDTKGEIVWMNNAVKRISGYTVDEYKKFKKFPNSTTFLLDERDIKVIWNYFKNKEAGNDRIFEIKSKNGRIILISISWQSIYNSSGKWLGTRVSVRDSNKRRDYEELLSSSEEKLQVVQSMGRIGYWEFDVKNQKIEWSDNLYVLYGRDKVLGPPSVKEESMYYSKKDQKELKDYAANVINTGMDASYDFELNLPGGVVVFFQAVMKPIKNKNGKVEKLFGVVQDISRRKLIQKKLEDSNQRYKSLIDNLPNAIYEVDNKGVIRYMSSSIFKILGFKSDEVLGKNFIDFVYPEDKKLAISLFKKSLAGSKTPSEWRAINKKGQPIWIQVIDSVYKNGKKVIGVSGVLSDISDIKKSELELKNKLDEVERLNNLMVGRELKMIELKEEIKELKK